MLVPTLAQSLLHLEHGIPADSMIPAPPACSCIRALRLSRSCEHRERCPTQAIISSLAIICGQGVPRCQWQPGQQSTSGLSYKWSSSSSVDGRRPLVVYRPNAISTQCSLCNLRIPRPKMTRPDADDLISRNVILGRKGKLQRCRRPIQRVRSNVARAQGVDSDDEPIGTTGHPRLVQRAVAMNRHR